jgi:hypothetical protein
MKCNANNCNTTAQKGGDFVPRLAMINDIAGFGRCSTTVSLPVISVMKVQVCPVPTSVLSNHLPLGSHHGYPRRTTGAFPYIMSNSPVRTVAAENARSQTYSCC